ncbi:MAG: alpha/beta hydrolase [Candidatus Dormibacteraeota bacterium]|nr:alpha/beta hydrolase [Candidatus Dormibacteraeota bacterium]
MQEIHLDANGLRFRCLADGPENGPPVLLLHGFPEGAESWGPQLPVLAAAGLRAVAPDLRGYGGTDRPEAEADYRMPLLLDDVEGLIDALGAERCHLAGHDWGAIVGWAFASRRPTRLRSWTALSVGHPHALAEAARTDDDQRRRSAYIGLFREAGGKAETVLAEDGYRRLRAIYRFPPNPDAFPADVIEHYVEGFARPGRLTAALNYYRASMGRAAYEAFPPAPDPVTVPTLLVWGDEDPALGRRGTEATAAHVTAEYRLEVLSGAGHWLQFERPEDVSRLLWEWITGHP